MIKRFPMLLLAVVLALPAVAVRAQDEDENAEEAPAQKAPAAAAAARNKGYHAEDATQAATHSEDDDAPAAGRPAQGSFTPPPPRQLGRSGSRANESAGGGGGSASGAGISCDKSNPKLTKVHKREINFFDKINRGTVIRYGLAPNEAASWRFKTPSSGVGFFVSEQGTSARSVGHMVTVSEVPCDFDTAKAMRKKPGCYGWAPVSSGVIFQIAPSAKPGSGDCILKPDTYYYMNIRGLMSPADGAPRDSCENELETFKSLGIKPLCGGIWVARGNFKWKDEAGERKRVDFKVNDSAHVGWQP